MKVIAQAQTVGVTASGTQPDRIAKAVAAAEGREAPTSQPKQQLDNSLNKIKMNTQKSVYRDVASDGQPTDQSNIPLTNEGTVVEAETKAIDPQVALEMRYKRALQKIAQEKDAKIKDLETRLTGNTSSVDPNEYIPVSALKDNPLGILAERGVTYDQLTEAILSNQQHENNPSFIKLRAEIQELKSAQDQFSKLQTERDELNKQQVLVQMEKDALEIASTGDEYELVRATKSVKDVVRLIDNTYEKTGEILDVEEAMKLVEAELENQALVYAKSKKVQGKMGIPAEQTQSKKDSSVRPMRTLTSRDSATPPADRRARAINAFYGRK